MTGKVRFCSSSVLLKQRIVPIDGTISEKSAVECIAQMLWLAGEMPLDSITLAINSPGGHISASIAIIRAIDDLACTVSTHCGRSVGGTAIAIAAHGARSFRSALPTSEFSFCTASPGLTEAYVESELSQFDQELTELLAEDAGRHEREVLGAMRSERRFSALEAMEFGLIDYISDEAENVKPPEQIGWVKRLWNRISQSGAN